MAEGKKKAKRIVPAVHGLKTLESDPDFELGFSEFIQSKVDLESLVGLNDRFKAGGTEFDRSMRRIIWRAITRRFGRGVQIGSDVGFKHLETFEIGDGVFIGDQSYFQGRHDGHCIIGNFVWIGPQCYFDARDLIIGDYVGWGPGARVLGSVHQGNPLDRPIIQTDLEIKPVRVEAWADIGVNSVILPGVTIGRGSIVGAGSVVTKDVPPFAVVSGIPARFFAWREDINKQRYENNEK